MTTEAGLSSFILLFCLLPLPRDASTGQLHQPAGLRHEEKQGPPPLRVEAQISACMEAVFHIPIEIGSVSSISETYYSE